MLCLCFDQMNTGRKDPWLDAFIIIALNIVFARAPVKQIGAATGYTH